MFKRLLISAFTLALAAGICVNVMAQTRDMKLNVFSEELVSPLNFDVTTGETLNLKIVNKSDQAIKFEVPIMSISVEVDKNSDVVVPMNFSNPAEKNVWYIVKQEGSNNHTGLFRITDFTIKVPTSDVNSINTGVLKDIINYDTTFVYEDKPEPIYRTTPAPTYSTYEPMETPIYTEPEPVPVEKPVTPAGGYVRGYW
ncbi:MAG: hypothetical protein AB1782_07850 [Cyanobacteriota bacterium]